MTLTLRPFQQECLDALRLWFTENPIGSPIACIPTGGGKSLLIATILREAFRKRSTTRALVLAHRKELIVQNANELRTLWPEAPIGIYSAGLGEREAHARCLVAGIQSVYKKAEIIGHRDIVLIDECHLFRENEEGMYGTFLAGLREINPSLRLLGLSATPYRLSSGLIIGPEKTFTDIAYEIGIRELIEQGYLSPLRSKAMVSVADLSKVSIRGGEYVQAEMEDAFNDLDLVSAAVTELCRYGADRKSWLIFCAGVEHAENVTKEIRKRGHTAECLVGSTESLFRDQYIRDFREGKLRALVGVDVLSVGFNARNVDLVAVLRATQSPGWWVQAVGRGTRLSPETEKRDCLILDYGKNSERLGPVDAIRIARRRNPLTGKIDSEIQTVPAKICPSCRELCHLSARTCPECSYEFPSRLIEHSATPSDSPILSTEKHPPVIHTVLDVTYRRHEKAGSFPSLRVLYTVKTVDGIPVQEISEWVCFEHSGFARMKAERWWKERRGEEPPPATVEEALERVREEIPPPTTITTVREGKYHRVVAVGYERREELQEGENDPLWVEDGVNI